VTSLPTASIEILPVTPLPTASIVIPTRDRPAYLDVALASIVPQAQRAGAELLVVSDGPSRLTGEVAGRHGVRVLSLPAPVGLNAARNAALGETVGELLVFCDDDVYAPPGWLSELLAGARREPGCDVFGGPIIARLEGGGPRACGRESAPISTLELGPGDRDVEFVWGANMAIRRGAFERIGKFDETISGRGDEEEWERRYAAAGGRVRYVAKAALEHRRTAADAKLLALTRAGYRHGKAAHDNDVRKGTPPGLAAELITLAGCVGHVFRRRCPIGIVSVAHSSGRVRRALAERDR
jgi:GT2 family glycosyltransferase